MRIRVVILTAGALILLGLGVFFSLGYFHGQPTAVATKTDPVDVAGATRPAPVIATPASAPVAPPKPVTPPPAPAPVAPLVSADGVVLLPAAAARIAGFQLHLEHPAQPNLTYWVDPEEYAEWRHWVPARGKYTVEVTYACAKNAGGRFRVASAGTFSEGAVTPTGDWNTYQTLTLPHPLILTADWSTITIKCDGNPNHALMNLRQIRLIPVK